MTNVFGFQPEQLNYSMDKAKQTLQAKLDPNWIKTREQAGQKLSYIGGHTVINLLNKAFNYQWSFEIISEEIVESLPKPATTWNKQTRKKEAMMEKITVDGADKWVQKMEPQPPVAKVKGRLTVPGLGVKEQYGSKVIVGGATEQESSFKAASTDAMKKCASLFGIGNELYGDEEFTWDGEDEVSASTAPVAAPVEEPKKEAPAPAPAPQKPVTQATPTTKIAQTASSATVDPDQWQQADIDRLKELKAIMGITDNAQLNPYTAEFFGDPNADFNYITPRTVKQFNVFFAQKAEQGF